MQEVITIITVYIFALAMNGSEIKNPSKKIMEMC
jgi:hypothetical protein